MRFGVSFPPGPTPAEPTTSVWFDLLLRLACRADEIGYEHVQVAELPLSVVRGHGPDPVPLLSAVSALTVGIRVGVAAVVPDRAHVLELADRLAMLDNLCHGRLDVSFCRASVPARPWLLRMSAHAGRDRFDDGMDMCRRLWSGHWVGSLPGSAAGRSYQDPHPPMFVASATSASVCAEAGRAGYHLQLVPATTSPADLPVMVAAYRAGRSSAGLKPGRVRLDYTCYLADDDQSARMTARRHHEEVLASVNGTTNSPPPADRMYRTDFERAHAENRILAGGPARLRDQIAGIADTVGQEVSLQVKLPRVAGVDTERALELFAEEVMPYFSSDPADACQGA